MSAAFAVCVGAVLLLNSTAGALPAHADAPHSAASTSFFSDLLSKQDKGMEQAPVDVSPMPETTDLTAEEKATVSIFNANTPSVVNIANIAYARRGYSMDVMMIPQGTGSGFIWDNRGTVVTNYHVVKGAAEVKVTLIDSSTYSARLLGFDENKDVAVLKLDMPEARARELKAVQLGRSAGVVVGQKVYAIGNPFGLDHTLTAGVVSGLGREIQANQYSKIKGVIQTDAAINPGNSGGVLLNSRGQLIGVNSAILDPSMRGSFSGVGFAIPIDMVKGLVEQILTYGRVIRPVLGITLAPPQLLSRFNIEGVLVMDAPPESPAGQAGIQGTYRTPRGELVLGDIIVGLQGRAVHNYAELFEALDGQKPGDSVRVEVLRPDRRGKLGTVTLDVVLGERDKNVADG